MPDSADAATAASRDDVASSNNEEDNPGRLFAVYSQNELVAERLKLLNYETEFVSLDDSLKAVPRHYFVKSTNVGEQFHIFSSLCVWLIRKAGIAADMEMPQEFNDPNATIAQVLDAIKTRGIEVDFPPNKLKSGSGPQCVSVLFTLTGLALGQIGFQFGVLRLVEEEGTDVDSDHQQQLEADQALLTADQFDDEVEFAEDEDQPQAEIGGGDTAFGAEADGSADVNSTLKGIMRSSTADQDHLQMQEELKRVLPQLKITVRANHMKDWRMHVEQMEKLEKALGEQYAELRPFLARTSDEINEAMERIGSREQHLNDQFAGLLSLYRNKQNELATISEQYKESSGTLNSRADTLNALNEEIEQLKQQIEEQGMQNTSGAPILKIKQALATLDKNCFVMRVQIQTLEHALMQTQLADRLNNTGLDLYE